MKVRIFLIFAIFFDIKKEIANAKDDVELEFCKKRLAMFNNGSIEILVGDKTTTERREKKMRFDDALCAISQAASGVIIGSGIELLRISKELEEENNGFKIFKEILSAPFKQIMFNAGIDYKEPLKTIEENGYNLIYNLNNFEYENITTTDIVDSAEVVINSLISATSIASMLLTTNSIVINECTNNINKVTDYNEL